MNIKQKFSKLVFTSFIAAGLLSTALASADVTLYSIDAPNSALSSFTGPYASLQVNLTSPTTANLTFTSLDNGGYTYLMGATGSADINVNAASWTLSALNGTNSISGF